MIYANRMFMSVISLVLVLSMILPISSSHSLAQTSSMEDQPRESPNIETELDTTPTVIVNQMNEEYWLESGLLYWADHCWSDEFNPNAHLRRMPSYGGTVRLLSDINNYDLCATFLDMVADNTGLYYYNTSTGRVEFRSSGFPYDPPTIVHTFTPGLWRFYMAIDTEYLYGVDALNKRIFRVERDGSGAVKIADTGWTPSRPLLADNKLYWAEDGGLWTIDLTCASPPCAKQKIVNFTSGSNLMHYSYTQFPLLFSEIYWVEANTTIRKHTCEYLFQAPGDWTLRNCRDSTIYTAPSDHQWWLGVPMIANNQIYWIERYFDSTGSDGRLRRMSYPSGTVADIAVNRPSLKVKLFADELGVYFSDDAGIYRLPFNATAIVRDLAAEALEVTQGIQNLANDVPLTAEKSTFVRGYGRSLSGPRATAVEAYLYGTRNDLALPGSPLHSRNGVEDLFVGGGYDRANRNAGWLFQLPASWDDPGSISLRLLVDPRNAYSDPNRGNNELTRPATFTARAPICTVYVPVRTHGAYASTDNPNFWSMVNLGERLWPTQGHWTYYQDSDIAETEVCWATIFPYPCFGPYELPDDSGKVLTSLNTRDFFSDDPDECDDANATTYYIGMIDDAVNTNISSGTVLGASYINDNVVWMKFPPASPTSSTSSVWPDAGTTLAHELGHSVGRHHVNCGGPDGIDTSYPYPTNQIDNVGAANHYGFDAKFRIPFAPVAVRDLMSYCDPVWTSDYSWKAIFNRLASGVRDVANSQSAMALTGDVVLINGSVNTTNHTGELRYAWVYPTAAMSAGMLRQWSETAAQAAQSNAATYHVRLLNASNQVLVDQPVSLAESGDGYTVDKAFVTTVAAPTGPVVRIELLADTTVLASRSMGAAQPTVNLISPASGETVGMSLTLQWQGSDPDSGDALLYNLQYTPDNGATWLSLTTDYPGIVGTNTMLLTLPINSVPGSLPNQARIRVAASDGYHTGLALSAPFTVSNRPPKAFIGTPMDGQTIAAGEPLVLTGMAMDAEDGALSGVNLQWKVNNLAVGTGLDVTINGLMPGSYSVALTASDANAQVTTVQRNFTIAPLSIPLDSAPDMDGLCDDAVYANGVQLQLAPYPDGTQATVHLLRSSSQFWACFTGMNKGSGGPGAFAGVRIDRNFSRNPLAQSDDYGFFVGEDGGVFTLAGDGAGGFAIPGPSGLLSQVSATGTTWSAELAMDAALVNGWDHLVGLNLGHYWNSYQGDDYEWPFATGWNQPDTWAPSALGLLPQITKVTPDKATTGSAALQLAVEGSNFVNGAVIRWNGSDLPTIANATSLLATVDASLLTTAGIANVTVRNPGSGLDSAPTPFVILNPSPAIVSLNPSSVATGEAEFTLQVNGSGFVNGAVVLWDSVPCPTTFIDGTRLNAKISATLIAVGRTIGIAVLNPEPTNQGSAMTSFQVTTTAPGTKTFLPLVQR